MATLKTEVNKLPKDEICEKCFGSMKKSPEVGWEPCERGNIAGFDVYTCVCSSCGHKYEYRISRD